MGRSIRRMLALFLALLIVFSSVPTASFDVYAADIGTTDVSDTTAATTQTTTSSGITTTAPEETTTTLEETTTTTSEVTTTTTSEATTTTVSEESTTTSAEETTTTVPSESTTTSLRTETTTTLPEQTTTGAATTTTRPGAMYSPAPTQDIVCSLTVYYIFEDGNAAQPVFMAEYMQGDEYSVDVPTLTGYTATVSGAAVTGPLSGSITADTVITVEYIAGTYEYTVNHYVETITGGIPDEPTRSTVMDGKYGQYTAAAGLSDYSSTHYYTLPSPQLILGEGTVVDVYYYLNTYTVSFESNGGTYVSKRVLKHGATLLSNTVTAPTRSGYTFDGWYTDAALTQKLGTAATITGDVTYYAKWTAAPQSYSVVYWIENLDGGYDYFGTQSASADVGSAVTVTAAQANSFVASDSEVSTYFHLDTENLPSGTVAADGSTVLNVYFNRNVYTLEFDLDGRTELGWLNPSSASMTIGDTTYNLNNKYSVSVKYGENIASAWPTDATAVVVWLFVPVTYGLKAWTIGNTTFYTKQFTMDASVVGSAKNGDTITLTAMYEAMEDRRYVACYLEGTDGQYVLSDEYSHYFSGSNYDGGTFTPPSIPGYTVNISKSQTNGAYVAVDNVFSIYYDRASYNLEFYYGNTLLKSESVKYNVSITNKNYTPSRPEGLADYYEFGGWYSTSNCVDDTEFIWDGATMPASSLAVYSKWTPKQVTVSFETNGGTQFDNQVIPAGTAVSDPGEPERSGYRFTGWYADSALTDIYDMNTLVLSDTTVYAGWEEITDVRYTIHYLNADTNASVFDSVVYTGKANTTIPILAKTHGTLIADEAVKYLTLSYNEDENVITFYYDEPADIYYKVVYMYGDDVIASELPTYVDGKTQIALTAKSELIPAGYYLTTRTRTFHLANENSVDEIEQNILVFECETYDYNITYNLAGGALPAGTSNPVTYTVRDTFTLVNPERTGYTFIGWTEMGGTETSNSVTISAGSLGDRSYTAVWEAKSDASYTVHYYLNGTTTSIIDDKVESGLTFDTSHTENAPEIPGYDMVAPTTATIVLNAYGKEHTFFYTKRTDLEYTVYCYLVGTELPVRESITVGGQIYLDSVSVSAPEVDGYTLTGDSVKRIDSIDISGNTVVFEYLKDITVTVKDVEVVYGDAINCTYSATDTYGSDELDVTIAIDTENRNVGTYEDVLVVDECVINRNGEDVSNQYNVIPVAGKLTITKRAATITSPNAEKTYDGTALTNDAVIIEGFVEGEGVDVTVTGTQTYVGESDNTFTYEFKEGTLADNYDVTTSFGKLTVTADSTEILVTADSADKTYDGTELTDSGYTVNYGGDEYTGDADNAVTLPNGDTVTVTVSGLQITVGGAAGNNKVDSIVITRGNEVLYNSASPSDADEYSKVSAVDGTLTVTARPVTVTTLGGTDVYSGSALTVTDGHSVSNLADGHSYTLTITGTQTEVGESDNTYANLVIKDAQGNDVTANYSISDNLGKLVVTTAGGITITADSSNKTYDAAELTDSGYTVSFGGTNYTGDADNDVTLPNGDVISVTVAGSITNVGIEENVITGVTINNVDSINGNANYESVNVSNGTLEITERTVTVDIDDESKVYDGTDLTAKTYSISGQVEGHEVALTLDGKQREVGDSHSTVLSSSLVITDKDGNDVTANYALKVEEGNLVVTERTVTITVKDIDKTYDGTELVPVDYTAENLVVGHEITAITLTGSQINVGTSDSSVDTESIVVSANGTDVTANYKFTIVDGVIEVTKRAATITSPNAEKTYDGTALTDDAVIIEGFVEGEGVDVTVTGTQTYVGESDNTFTYDFKEGTLADNYDVTTTFGKLTVTADSTEILVTADSSEKTYDGTELTDSGYTVTYGGKTIEGGRLENGDTVTATVSGSQTDVGSSANTVTAVVIKDAQGNDVTENYSGVKTADGTLTVNAKAITVTTPGGEKVYDGAALTVTDGHSVEGLVTGHSYTLTITGTQTNVGESDNTYANLVIKDAQGNDVTANYSVTTETLGKLIISKRIVTITVKDIDKVYDGTELVPVDYTAENLVGGHEITAITLTGTQTNVSSSGSSVDTESIVVSANGTDVTANYDFTITDGVIEVTKRAASITSPSAEKTYDGTALTNDEVVIENFVEGEGVDVTVTGTQTYVGESDNTFTYEFKDGTLAENYDVTTSFGKLTVTADSTEILVTADSSEKTYDGTELTDSGYTVNYGGDEYTGDADNAVTLPNGDTVTVIVSGSQTTVGGAAGNNKVDSIVITRGNEVLYNSASPSDADEYSKVSSVDGTLTVTARPVTVTTLGGTEVYSGSALTAVDGHSVSNLADGHSYTLTITGTQTEVGESDNTYANLVIKDAQGADVTANYSISDNLGKLVVTTAGGITITADSSNKTYDAAELTDSGYTVSFGGSNYTGDADNDVTLPNGDVISVTVAGSITNVGIEENVITGVTINNVDSLNGNANYESVNVSNGTLEITERTVTVDIDDESKVYDGTDLTAKTYSVSGQVDGHEVALTLDGAQKEVGDSHSTVLSGSLVITDADGNDVTANYALEVKEGNLVVTERTVTITVKDIDKVYDGTELVPVDYTAENLVGGHEITAITLTGTQTNVGTSGSSVDTESIVVFANGTDVTANYKFTITDGVIEVTKRAATITSPSAEKTYDGTALTDDAVIIEGFVEGEGVDVTVTGTQTYVGESDNTFTYDFKEGTFADNYDVTTSFGKLTVTADGTEILVTADSSEKTYDGTELTDSGYTVNYGGDEYTGDADKAVTLPNGDTVTVIIEGGMTDAGTAENSVVSIVIRHGDTVVFSSTEEIENACYANVSAVAGTLTIDARPVTITVSDAEKVYDGTELTIDSAYGDDISSAYTVALDETVSDTDVTDAFCGDDEISEITFSGSQTVAGSSEAGIDTILITSGDKDVTANYDITVVNGILTVTRASLTITASSASKVYDGKELVSDEYTAEGLAAGDEITCTVVGSQTNVGTSVNTLTDIVITRQLGDSIIARLFSGETTDVTDCYDITVVDGELEVTKRAITITADSLTETYNGAAHSIGTWKITAGSLAEGDTVRSAVITGSQLEVGTCANVISNAVIVNEAGEDVTSNYDITYVDGKIVVIGSETPKTNADANTAVFGFAGISASMLLFWFVLRRRRKAEEK